MAAGAATGAKDHEAIVPPTIKITSPLGRSGLPGTIRIVARIETPMAHPPTAVTFFVDGEPLSTDSDLSLIHI